MYNVSNLYEIVSVMLKTLYLIASRRPPGQDCMRQAMKERMDERMKARIDERLSEEDMKR